jgi:cobalt-zinc-cadmium efflux system protein
LNWICIMEHHHSHLHHTHGGNINYNKAFAVGISLNMFYVLAECYYGWKLNSLALLSDAGHNLGDVLTLLLSWAAEFLVKRKAFGQFTYGLKRASILIAFVNTLLLVLALGGITWEAIHRLNAPVESDGLTMAMVAVLGILVNAFTAYLFYQPNGSNDTNIKSAFLHMASDALVSAGVVLAGLIIYYTHWYWMDPLISIVIVLVILSATWKLLKDSGNQILDAAPYTVEVNKVKNFLESVSGVLAIHDLHVWNLSTKQTALTVHLIMPEYQTDDEFLRNLEHELHHRFEITHVTIQIEKGNNCVLGNREC